MALQRPGHAAVPLTAGGLAIAVPGHHRRPTGLGQLRQQQHRIPRHDQQAAAGSTPAGGQLGEAFGQKPALGRRQRQAEACTEA